MFNQQKLKDYFDSFRQEHKVTNQDIAEYIGMSTASFSRLTKGNQLDKALNILQEYAKVRGTSPTAFLLAVTPMKEYLKKENEEFITSRLKHVFAGYFSRNNTEPSQLADTALVSLFEINELLKEGSYIHHFFILFERLSISMGSDLKEFFIEVFNISTNTDNLRPWQKEVIKVFDKIPMDLRLTLASKIFPKIKDETDQQKFIRCIKILIKSWYMKDEDFLFLENTVDHLSK